MKMLREDITIEQLNEMGDEYLPGFLGLKMVELEEGSLNCTSHLTIFCMPPALWLWPIQLVAMPPSHICRKELHPSRRLS